MRRRFTIYLVIASFIGAFFLWLAARELPFATIGDTLQLMGLERLLKWTAIFSLIYGVCHAARLMRWYELLRQVGDVKRVDAYKICAVGFLAILILPLRLGEFVRPYLVANRSSLSMSAALGTVVLERVLDGLVITGLLFVTLTAYSTTHDATGFAMSLALFGAAIFVPALGVCLLSVWRRELAGKLVNFCFALVPTIGARVNQILDSFLEGIEALRSGGTLARFLGFTIVYWAANGLSMYVLAVGLFEFDMEVWDAFTLLAVLVIGIMLPAGPGLAGNYEYFVGKGMELFTDNVAGVAAFAATMHVLQFVVILIPGLWVLAFDRGARAAFGRAVSDSGEENSGNSAI